jgi:hypothetical protein
VLYVQICYVLDESQAIASDEEALMAQSTDEAIAAANKSIMQYVCLLGWIGVASVLRTTSGGKATKAPTSGLKHQDNYDRERHAKRMENPKQAFEENKRRNGTGGKGGQIKSGAGNA